MVFEEDGVFDGFEDENTSPDKCDCGECEICLEKEECLCGDCEECLSDTGDTEEDLFDDLEKE